MNIYLIKKMFSLSILLSVISCNIINNSQVELPPLLTNDSLLIIDIDNAKEINCIPYSNFFSKAHAIILESNDNCLIGHINKMQIWKDFIIILDSNIGQSILIFNKNGQFIRKIGGIGQGIGEYISVNDFTIDEINQSLFLLDNTSQKINIYNLMTGEYIKSIKINTTTYSRSYHIHYDKDLYADVYFQNPSKSNYLLQKIKLETTEQIGKYLNVEKYNKGWSNLYYVENSAFLHTEDDDKVYFIQQFMDTIIAIKNNQVYPYAIIKCKSFVSKEDLFSIDKNRGNKFPLEEITQKNKMWYIREIIEHSNYLFFKCWKKNFQQCILYNKEEKETYVCYREKNDILYNKEIEKGVSERQMTINKEGVYSYIRMDAIPLLIEYAKENFLSLPHDQIEKIKHLTENSNPVIIRYEYKK